MAEGQRLSGRRIVVTGATRGFGYAMVRAFLLEGARVALCGRSWGGVERALERLSADLGPELCGVPAPPIRRSIPGAPSSAALAATAPDALGGAGPERPEPAVRSSFVALQGRLVGAPCDTRDERQLELFATAVEEVFGGFDVWVNNAGVSGPYGEVETLPLGAYRDVIDTNILGTYFGTLTALRRFLPRRSGKIINIAGRGAEGRPSPFQSAYAPSKAWVQSFTRSVAGEHKKSGVGVYVLNPGMMLTDMVTCVDVSSPRAEQRLRRFPTVLAALAHPPDVPAKLAVHLASSETDGKTGLVVKALDRRTQAVRGCRYLLARLRGRAPKIEVEVCRVPREGEE